MKKFSRAVFDLFVFSSFYIAICAFIMALQTYFLFNEVPAYSYLWFVFFGTLCSYNFHWYLTPSFYSNSYKASWSVKHKKLHLFLFAVSLIASAYYIFLLREHWLLLLASAFVTFLYSAPKIPHTFFQQLQKIAIGKTIFLSFVWTHITSILPLLLADIEWMPEHILFVINRFFFIYAICIVFDYRDRENDKKEGIKSLVTYLNTAGINRLFWISLTISLLTLLYLYVCYFSTAIFLALFIPIALLALLYEFAKKRQSDYLYYFILDGLMMFSAILLLIFQI